MFSQKTLTDKRKTHTPKKTTDPDAYQIISCADNLSFYRVKVGSSGLLLAYMPAPCYWSFFWVYYNYINHSKDDF